MYDDIVTERLLLVPLRLDVARRVVAGDLSGIRAATGWPHADTLDALRGFAEHGSPGETGGWLVTLRNDGTVIGDCGWHGGADESGTAEIGYGLAAPYRGQRYGVEAVAGMVDWSLRQPRVRRLVAETLADNLPSRRILERLGFTIDRVEPPMVHFGLDAPAAGERRLGDPERPTSGG